ncbi:MAG: sensor histidine kinase, partial [Acidimicrobiales bacterium]
MFKRVKATRLSFAVVLPLLAMVLLMAIVFSTLQTVMIGSSDYDEITQAKDLVAQVQPPPQFVQEAFLLLHQLAGASDRSEIDSYTERFQRAETEYRAQHDHWTGELAGGSKAQLREALLQQSFEPAVEFFRLADEEFFPAYQAGRTEQARALLSGRLLTAFEEHRAATNEVNELARARQLRIETDAQRTVRERSIVLLFGFLALALLGGYLGLKVIRSFTGRLDRLQKVAVEELPKVIEEMRTMDLAEKAPSFELIPVEKGDEFSEVAASFNTVVQTAVDLAADQAQLRRNASQMFVNLGRRNHSLLSRTISFITELEQHEQDPKVLEDLFRLDHLATRMRRNAESLLVLAGAPQTRTWSEPVEIGDMVRSALAEIEAYTRVDLQRLDPVKVRGAAVADVAHLIAELLENGTNFSPPTTKVSVVGRQLADGYLVSIIDHGIGMGGEDLAEANRRLTELTHFDVSPLKVLGLFVVGRLAARHHIQVRLGASTPSGVTAYVKLPLELIVVEESRSGAPADAQAGLDLAPQPLPAAGAATAKARRKTPKRTPAAAAAPAPVPAV